jgi:hypothetical protein
MFNSTFRHSSPRFNKPAVAALLGILILVAMVSAAAADGVYHSEHIEFYPVGDQPLRSGFVENIHTNGPQLYAVERYVLNGASPNTEFYIKPLIYLANAGCTEELIPFPITTSFITNHAGNGTALVTLPPEAAAGLGGLTVNVRWQLLVGAADGPVAYETGCAVVTLD